jgi:hypothetical protein
VSFLELIQSISERPPRADDPPPERVMEWLNDIYARMEAFWPATDEEYDSE